MVKAKAAASLGVAKRSSRKAAAKPTKKADRTAPKAELNKAALSGLFLIWIHPRGFRAECPTRVKKT